MPGAALKSARIEVDVRREGGFRVRERASGLVWEADARDSRLVLSRGGSELRFPLLDAGRKELLERARGVLVVLGGFPGAPEAELTLHFGLCEDEKSLLLEARLSCSCKFVELIWPPPLSCDRKGCAVVPLGHGAVIPDGWKQEIRFRDLCWTRSLTMEWFGEARGGGGYLAAFETPDDAGVELTNEPGRKARLSPWFCARMRTFGYPRRMRYIFLERADHNSLAKAFRAYLDSRGRKTLEEKSDELPHAKKLLGALVLPMSICTNRPRDRAHAKAGRRVVTFAERASQLERVREMGFERVVAHVDGWGQRGYDNLHPAVLPPCPEAGGWDGLKALQDKARELGYLFCLHDNYRDYYLDSPLYDPGQALVSADGSLPGCDLWDGGENKFLCARFAPAHLERNYSRLREEGISPDASYLDVFAIVPLEECHSPAHPMTRDECRELRTQCFRAMRRYGMVISSEEPVGWAVDELDFFYWAPFALTRFSRGEKWGVPAGLFSLVHHDSVVVPWNAGREEYFGTPREQFLWCLLFCGPPHCAIGAEDGAGEEPAWSGRARMPSGEEVERLKLLCRFHRICGAEELVSHDFLSPDRASQRTVFASGATAEVDFSSGEYSVRAEGLRASGRL